MDKRPEKIVITGIEFWGEWERNQGGMRISWSSKEGFGELDIMKDNNGKLVTSTECMCNNEDKAFIKEVLESLIDKLEVIE